MSKFRKPQHIIIDGADGTGKSTVVQMLSRKYNLPIIKMPVPQDKVRTEVIEPLSEMFNKTIVQFHENDFIMDRGFTSSIVYSRVFERTHNLNYIHNIEQILDPVVIIMSAFEEGTNYSLRDDDIYNQHEIDKVDREFLRLADEKNYPVIYVKGKSLIQVVNEAIDIIEHLNPTHEHEW